MRSTNNEEDRNALSLLKANDNENNYSNLGLSHFYLNLFR